MTIELPGEVAASDSNNFTMWLLFRPDGGQWVPVRNVNWNWYGAAATNSSTGWIITGSSWSTNPPDSAPTTYPVWSSNAADTNAFPWIPPLP